ncbi:hypothetical protein EV127DRAFT_488089 [Xylaria flabelliformis]|nr:hypothetical protein EV127DRAFT_488089 [Xylaria flabelliformis]
MAPTKKKWDEKMERDFLLAIRIAESGYNPITRDTWNKATELMKMMGYVDSTWTGISQRWSKNIQKDFQIQYPQALQVATGQIAVGTAVAGPATVPATVSTTTPSAASGSGSGARRGRAGRVPKREREEEDEDDEEIPAKKTPAAKKQKRT